MGLKGRYLSEGVRNMVRFSGRNQPDGLIKGLLWSSVWVRSCWRRPLAHGGLLRLGAQKQERERKQRPGTVLWGDHFRAKGHVGTL